MRNRNSGREEVFEGYEKRAKIRVNRNMGKVKMVKSEMKKKNGIIVVKKD